ncbi:MAG: hypothetical protein NWE95_10280 [Candidatus Bathyarchaeota archaeon]|nr:hypothetical protein [Candidatus Bathyarchaeota archaeon]
MMNSSSEHVTASSIYGSGEVDVNATTCTIILIGPVGPGNLTVGLARAENSRSSAPEGLFPNAYVVPAHVQVVDTTNQTIVEKDVITPHYFPVNFTTRGQYKVYLTNTGNESSPIPVGLQFEEGNPQNIEKDKHQLSIVLIGAGIALMCIGLIVKLLPKKGNMTSRGIKKQVKEAKP